MPCKYCENFEGRKLCKLNQNYGYNEIEKIKYQNLNVSIVLYYYPSCEPEEGMAEVGDEAGFELMVCLDDDENTITNDVKDLDEVFKRIDIDFCPFCGRKINKKYDIEDAIEHTKNSIRYFQELEEETPISHEEEIHERKLYLAELIMNEEVKNGSDTEAH